jgi:hypothetical protein
LAQRRYEAADPENRLVAAELETRWNATLERAAAAEQALQALDARPPTSIADQEALMCLAQDLPTLWQAATTDKRLKQRIVCILLQEIAADVDEQEKEVRLTLHWIGGRHSQLVIPKNRTGSHRNVASADAIAVIASMAGRFDDATIAATLNRLQFSTGLGNSWIESRVKSARIARGFANYDPAQRSQSMTLQDACETTRNQPNGGAPFD